MKPKRKALQPSFLSHPTVRVWLGFGFRLLLAIWIWAIGLQIKFYPAAAGLDQSGGFAFNYAHARGLVFGRDVAFTYGPLAYLTLPMPVGNNLRQGILFQFSMWLVFVAITGWLCFGRRVRLAAMLLFGLGLYSGSEVFRVFGYAGPDMYLVYLGMLLVGASISGRRWMLWYGGAAAVCTIVFFVKFSSAAMLAGTMGTFALSLLVTHPSRGRRALLIVAAVPAAIVLVHVLCYGSPEWLWRYIRVAMEMSAGYGVTMSQGTDNTAVATAIAIMAAWLAGTAVLWWRGVNSWGLALACAGPLFLEFKHSFAREAGHIEIFFLFLPLLWGLVALFTDVRRKDAWYVTGPLLVVLALWYPRESAHVRGLLQATLPLRNYSALRDIARLGELERNMKAGAAAALAPDLLPDELLARVGRSPIAVFPMECSYGGANPIEMRPFPIFQSYQAYTPYLDQWNASFLEDAQQAPAFILFDWDTVDGRHPLLDVPATAVSMYRHYELDGMYGAHLLLRRRGIPRFPALRPVESREMRLDQPVGIGAGDHPRMARIFLRWNLTGRLLKFLFRLPEVRLVVSSSAGRVLNVRVPSEVLEDGVPNFLPFNLEEARALFGNGPSGRIDSLLVGGPGARYLEPRVRVEIYEDSAAIVTFGAPAVPHFTSLRRLGTLDSVRIEMLNDTGASAFAEVTVPNALGYVRVRGWAVIHGEAAGGVFVELDGKAKPAEYGIPRADVGALYRSAEPLRCGFEWSVPAWEVGKDWHELSVKVLAPDGSGYYDGERKLRFKME